jgi:uncharacterized protein YndB with AHSA1/START domain
MDPVVIKRVFPCNKRQLFEAWSKPSVVAKWFFSSQEPLQQSTFSNTFTVGGPLRIDHASTNRRVPHARRISPYQSL